MKKKRNLQEPSEAGYDHSGDADISARQTARVMADKITHVRLGDMLSLRIQSTQQ